MLTDQSVIVSLIKSATEQGALAICVIAGLWMFFHYIVPLIAPERVKKAKQNEENDLAKEVAEMLKETTEQNRLLLSGHQLIISKLEGDGRTDENWRAEARNHILEIKQMLGRVLDRINN